MGLTEKLAGLLKGLLKGIVQIDVHNPQVSVNVTNNHSSPSVSIHKATGSVQLNLGTTVALDKEKIQEAVKEALQNNGFALLEVKSEGIVEDIKKKESIPGNREILDKLSNYITSEDHSALRASLYLREKFKEGQNVTGMKDDIFKRFGARGGKISNLCSSDYFENTIIPALEAMQKDLPSDKARQKFSEFFDLTVQESGFAVFVPGDMTQRKVEDAIVNRIGANISYGKKYVHVHGIGKSNIRKIEKAVVAICKRYSNIDDAEKKKTDNTIYLKLEVKGEKLEAANESSE